MPRVRHTLKGREVIEAWLNQSQDWARNSSGTVRFEGPLLYNERGDECMERRDLGNGHVILIEKSYHLPYYRSYCESGYSAERMAKEYCQEHANCIYADSGSNGLVIGLIRELKESIPYYYVGTAKPYEEFVGNTIAPCVKKNFEGLYKLRTFLRGAGIETLEQLDGEGVPEDKAEYLRSLLFGKVDALRFFRVHCNYDYRRREIDRAFGEGALDRMLQDSIAEYSHLLNGEVSGGCEYASFWAGQ